MPVVDRREFGGRFTVKENSQRLANYRYLEVQLMEMIAGWSHTTPQLAFKAASGYHVYDHAQAADMLGERLEQLRSGRDREEPATDVLPACASTSGTLARPSSGSPPSTVCWSRISSAPTPITPTLPTRSPMRRPCACCATSPRSINHTWPGARPSL